jgi:hypothetical protein
MYNIFKVTFHISPVKEKLLMYTFQFFLSLLEVKKTLKFHIIDILFVEIFNICL